MIRRTGDHIVSTFDADNYFCSNNLFVGIQKDSNYDLKYISALLNSRLITWFFQAIQPRVGKLFAELKINHLYQFPINGIDKAQQMPFIELVEKILKITKTDDYLKNAEKQAKVPDIERQIDELVYKLYGLIEDEIKIVEAN